MHDMALNVWALLCIACGIIANNRLICFIRSVGCTRTYFNLIWYRQEYVLAVPSYEYEDMSIVYCVGISSTTSVTMGRNEFPRSRKTH